jgi:uncharacterized protein with HEPN domain
MSKRAIIALLQDILDETKRIDQFTKGLNFKKFIHDTKTQYAITRSLEIIGEAVKKLPSDLKTNYTQIEWKKIAGLRDILIHDYFGINYKILWDIVQNQVPDLHKKIKQIIKETK